MKKKQVTKFQIGIVMAVLAVAMVAAVYISSHSRTGLAVVMPYDPVITEVIPNNGPMAGGQEVTVYGANFGGLMNLNFGGAEVVAESHTDTTILLKTPAHAVGLVGVTVATSYGTATLDNAYTYVAPIQEPTLISVSPNTDVITGGLYVTVTGTNLTGASSLTFGGVSATINGNDGSSLLVTVPAHAEGVVDLSVVTPNGVATLPNAFTYTKPVQPAPTLVSIAPAVGPIAGGTTVTLSGTNFSSDGETRSVVYFGSASPENLAVISSITPTQIVATTPAHTAAVVDVTVLNGALSATLPLSFTYQAPPAEFSCTGADMTPVCHLVQGNEQPLCIKKTTLDSYMRQNPMDFAGLCTGSGPGLAGGHFDLDIYYPNAKGSYGNKKHVHQYDDQYDITGEDLLSAHDPAFNLKNAIANTTPFKVLVMNQYLNPAMSVAVGSSTYESVKTWQNLAGQSSSAFISSLPTYTLADPNFSLKFNLPKTAFFGKDWWGDLGGLRAGLIPTQTGCVNKVGSTGAFAGQKGLNGERFDGAFTIQIVKASTPASALEFNNNKSDMKYGWRVKDNTSASKYFTDNVLAEYTVFWHTSGKCYGVSGWLQNPPLER